MLRKGAVLPSLGRRWPLRGGHFDCAIAGSACSLSTATKPAPPTPDFTTTVDVANIRLNRPTRRKRKIEGSWEGLPGLASRTQGSLIDSTLEAMDSDEDFKLTASRLRKIGAKRMTLEEKKQRRRALDSLGVPDFASFVDAQAAASEHELARQATGVLQLNIGIYCNQACAHCHVESSPKRTEHMSEQVAERCLELLVNSPSVHTLDLTGGAPEMQPAFRWLVSEARARAPHVLEIIDRCNLTVLSEPGQEDLPDFLAEHRVRVVASLPCYSAKNVNQQRGIGVFDRSIAALRTLNEYGFGVEGSGLHMDLVYNPLGAFLPPDQVALEAKYREEMEANFGVTFSSLYTITNMPIKRFADFLHRRGELTEYMDLLVRNFNPGTLEGLMCKTTASVNWDGRLYDCDFNQQLDLGIATSPGAVMDDEGVEDTMTVFDLASLTELEQSPILYDAHCFGCSAGMGSS